MYGNRTDRVVNPDHFIEELHGKNDYESAGQSDQRCPERVHRVASRRNSDQACQRSVKGHGHIRLPIAEPGKEHGRQGCHRGSKVGIEEHQRSAADQRIAVHAHGGCAVESEPAEPENEYAQCGNGQVVTEDGPRFPVLPILSDTGAQDLRTDQSAYTADHMNSR